MKKNLNVKLCEVGINNSAHILLIASKNIKKDEILYFNYNSGYNLYPTKNFVYKKK